MKNILITTALILLCSIALNAENNESIEVDNNSTTVENRADTQIKKHMKREQMFAEEQIFYHGKNHDLSYAEIDKDSIDSVPLIEPDYDFDMDDVYD